MSNDPSNDPGGAGVGVGPGEDVGAGSSLLLLNQPVVVDNGSSSIKAGFAGSSKPKMVIPTKVGRTKHMRIMPGGALEGASAGEEQQQQQQSSAAGGGAGGGTGGGVGSSGRKSGGVFVGSKLDEHRGAFVLEHPMDKGSVVDTPSCWDAMEHLWEHIYSKPCLNAKTEEHPILFTEAPLNPSRNRDQIAEIFFENMRVPAMYFTPPSVLSLYASGRTTGVVLDVGETTCHAVPVYEGFALRHSVTRSNIAGRDVTSELQLQLRKAGLCFTTTAEYDLCKSMKEELCFLSTALSGQEDYVQLNKDSKTQYQLPDGHVIMLGGQERYQTPNILFDPTLIGSEDMGVADVLTNSIMKSDLELRSKLFSQVVISGGTTLTPGFGDRLLAEVRVRAPSHTRIRISAPNERMYSAYVGGSILASLATFRQLWVSRSQYEEHGTNILHARDL